MIWHRIVMDEDEDISTPVLNDQATLVDARNRSELDPLTADQAWSLYLSHALSMWNSRVYEYGAVSPDSLHLASYHAWDCSYIVIDPLHSIQFPRGPPPLLHPWPCRNNLCASLRIRSRSLGGCFFLTPPTHGHDHPKQSHRARPKLLSMAAFAGVQQPPSPPTLLRMYLVPRHD